MRNKLLSKFSWLFIGNIVFALSQWLIIIVLANLGSEYDLGIYTYSLAIIAPVFMFFSFDLRRVVATSRRDDKEFAVIFLNRLFHLGLVFLLICLLIPFLNIDNKTIIIILLLTIYKIFEYVSDIIFGYFQQQNSHDLIGKSQMYRGILTIIIFIFVYYLTNNLIISVISLNIVMLLRVLFYDIRKLKNVLYLDPGYAYLKNLNLIFIMKINVSLGLTLLVNSLIVNLPRYYIEYFDGLTLVGYFSAIYYILVASNLVITPVTTMLAPHLRLQLDKSRKDFWRFLLKSNVLILMISTFFAIVAIYFSDWILVILYNQEFLNYKSVFVILIISLIFSFANGLLGLALITLKKKGIIFNISLINLLVTALIGYYLISNYSLTGAGYTILFSRILQFVMLYITVYYITKVFRNKN